MMPARHTKLFYYYYFNYFQHVAMLQKFAGPLVGAPFVEVPVRPTMPKSASGYLAHYCHSATKFGSVGVSPLTIDICLEKVGQSSPILVVGLSTPQIL